MCAEIAREIAALLRDKPTALLCIAAGHTSLGVFEHLIKNKVSFSKARFVAMDEWLGMSVKTLDSCGALLNNYFLSKVDFQPDHVRLFDGTVADLEGECRSVEAFIADSGAIDYLVLGSGMNGHLALNEPGSSLTSRACVVALSDTTKEVGQKYFKEQTALAGGITLGIANFAEAKRSVLMVSGAHKREILHKIISGPVDPAIPATAVHGFANASIYYDRDTFE